MKYKLFEEFVANKEQALKEAMVKPIHKSGSAKTMKPITDKTNPETAKPAKTGSMKDMEAMVDETKAKAPTAKHSAESEEIEAGKASKPHVGKVTPGKSSVKGIHSEFEAKK